MKILFTGINLDAGGIQVAMINTLKELVGNRENMEVDLFLFSYDGELIDEIPKGVNLIRGHYFLNLIGNSFDKVKKSGSIFKILMRILLMIAVRILGTKKFYHLMFLMQNKLREYDIAVAYFNDVSPTTYFNRGCNQYVRDFVHAKKKIAWLHTDPENAYLDRQYCIDTYSEFDRIAIVSKACKDKFDKIVPEFAQKSTVVYNLFPINTVIKKSTEFTVNFDISKVNIVTVARIDNRTKRIDRIIDVCSLLRDNNITNYKWHVVGDGPDLQKNLLQVNDRKLEDYIEFHGNQTNPYPYVISSDIFVLASDYEGYPMVVSEALILGIPVIATNYIAASEQIIDNNNGIIVEKSSEHIFKVLEEMITNHSNIERLKNNLAESKYSNMRAISQLNRLLTL